MKIIRNRFFAVLVFASIVVALASTASPPTKPTDDGQGPYNPTGSGYCHQHGTHHTVTA